MPDVSDKFGPLRGAACGPKDKGVQGCWFQSGPRKVLFFQAVEVSLRETLGVW